MVLRMTAEISPNGDTPPAQQSIAQDVEDIIGAVGNNPRLMVALTALGKFPEDTGGTSRELNQRIRILQGCPPSQSHEGENFVHSHTYGRIFARASLIEKPAPPGATLSAKGRLALSVSGVLLPSELNTPQERFLETVYGTYAHIGKTNPRPSVYRRLLMGPASSGELQEITNLPRNLMGKLLKELVEAGICECSRAPNKTKNSYRDVTLVPRFRRHIGTMLQSITSLCGEDAEGAKFRQNAADKARLIISHPDYVNKLLNHSSKRTLKNTVSANA